MNKGKIIADSFSKLGINFLHDACAYVWKLPYGRNSDRANWRLVLSELRGTCSTKHALLKELMDELNLNVDLVVGIYPMNEDNTPGVGSVITEQNFSYIGSVAVKCLVNGISMRLTLKLKADGVIYTEP